VVTQQTHRKHSDTGTAPVSYLILFLFGAVIATVAWISIFVLLAALSWMIG
jgi:hypothetical protein